MTVVESAYEGVRRIEQIRQSIRHSKSRQERENLTAQMADLSKQVAVVREAQATNVPSSGARRSLKRSADAPGRGDDFLGDGPPAADGRPRRPEIDVEATLHWNRLPTGIAHVLDPEKYPLVQYTVKPPAEGALRLRLRTHVEGFSAHSVDTVEIAKGDVPVVKKHLPTLFPDALRTLREATQATVHVEVQDLEAPGTEFRVESHATMRTCLLPTTTAVLRQTDPSTGAVIDLMDYLACWVTPNSDDVMDVVREAAGRTPTGQMVGYQTDPAGVEKQVRAIFETLRARGVAYVNSVLAVGINGFTTQRIRVPREALARRSANCIDGVVLYASLLEAASLDPAIVVVPGHAFVAWRTRRKDDPETAWSYLETTMTMTQDFRTAVEQGASAYVQANADGQATVVDVADRRQAGFLPLE